MGIYYKKMLPDHSGDETFSQGDELFRFVGAESPW